MSHTSDTLREAISHAGGLHSQAMIARRWDISSSAVAEYVRKPHFPTPVCEVDGRGLWAGNDLDAWRATERRPGPRAKP